MYSLLFSLLRYSLFGHVPSLSLYENCDWERLLAFAECQTVLGLVVDGIEGLPADVRPGRSLMMSAIGRVCGIERSNGVAKDVLGSLLAEYRSAGVEPVLMKGLGVGDRYPCPEHRACGDIDLFFARPSDAVKAGTVAKRLASSVDTFYAKHDVFSYKGVTVENHCRLCDFSNARFTAMLDDIVSRELSGDLSSVCPRRDIDGITVCELPPTLYAFFLLCHKATHVIEDGLGLRQVCDWAVFLSAEHERIDRNKFASWTSDLRLWPLAHAFGRICVDDLRLPESCLPFRLVRETGNYELLRRQILSGGNFGRLFYRYKGHVGKKEDMLRTMCVKMPRYASLYRLWPDEARWCYWAMLKRGVRRLAGR